MFVASLSQRNFFLNNWYNLRYFSDVIECEYSTGIKVFIVRFLFFVTGFSNRLEI